MNLRFLHSTHKLLYIRLAIRFLVSPNHVYDLAHGKIDVDTHKDHEIVRYFHKHKCFRKHHRRK